MNRLDALLAAAAALVVTGCAVAYPPLGFIAAGLSCAAGWWLLQPEDEEG